MNDVNIENFLQPIPNADNKENTCACGKYLKYDYIYDQIKECRREDDPHLTQGVWLIEPKKAAWSDVEKICASALKNKTKDLQIAVWWLEAKTAMCGFLGLNQGVAVLHALCKKYWDKIWPAIGQNGNLNARLAPFYFFAEKVSEKILAIPLTCPQDGVSSVFSLSDWITARHNLRLKSSSGISLKDFQKSAATTPIDFFNNVDNDANNVLKNLKSLEDFLNERCGSESPSFRLVYERINDIKQVNARNITERKKQLDAEEDRKKNAAAEDENWEEGSNDGKEKNPIDSDSKDVPTIEHAYSALNEIAAFLEKQQPQSPSSILIKIACAIGQKTFQELLDINSQNGAALIGTISELYGTLKRNSKSNLPKGNE